MTKIKTEIEKLKDTELISTRDMLNCGLRATVDSAMRRLVTSGELVRLAWGIFAKASHPSIDSITPLEIATKKAGSFGKRLTTTQINAAHDAGLTDQSDDRLAFATDGRSSRFRLVLTNETVHLIGRSARKMRLSDDSVGTAIRGLWHLTRERLNADRVEVATAKMQATERKTFDRSARWMPSWLSDFILELGTGKAAEQPNPAAERRVPPFCGIICEVSDTDNIYRLPKKRVTAWLA